MTGAPAPGRIPAVVAGLCDDAAIFPPGLAPLPAAVRAHDAAAREWYAPLVGPLVIGAAAVPSLPPLVAGRAEPLPVSVTFPAGPGMVAEVLAALAGMPVAVRAIEVAVPDTATVTDFLAALATAVSAEDRRDTAGTPPDDIEAGDRPTPAATRPARGVDVYVEIPRDERGPQLLAALPPGYRAKFRTGGVRADLYPDEVELGRSVAAAVAAGVPFKATAGLHHAVRNTDPATGFEQHGFLNLLLATDTLARGGSEADADALLAERDGATVAGLIVGLDAEVRWRFVSFGTCSITDPVSELVELGVLTAPAATGPIVPGAPR
ncbi:hypothetical protein [Acrocarpospora macrocephala]|uniref:hypothetical protein n=1 Tax=Acrocarpospora macrocephala TaxID=150177 RepID=UPI0012D358D0|nr:hypothetical protein [Acrocarpospora macrocephala]